MAKVTMPQLGESVAEGTVGRWLKKPGDRVAKSEPLLEVITDKVNAEVPSPFDGILKEILFEEGATVPNDAVIAVIETADGAEPAEAPAAAAPAASPPPAPPAVPATPAAPATTVTAAAGATRVPSPAAPAAPAVAPLVGDPDARMTPAVRRLLREHGLVPAQVVGSGHGGRITRDDVLRLVAGGGAAASPLSNGASRSAAAPAPAPVSRIVFPAGADEVLVEPTQMRKGIAAQMTRALAVPHAYVSLEVDVSNLVRLRESLKRDHQARTGVSLSFVPFVVAACVDALRRNPTFNAHWTDAGLVAKRRINVGIAVAVDDGLLVPVIRDVDAMSIAAMNQAIADVAARARAGKLRLDDFGGGTFTVDNTGWLGSNMTLPIVNVPEVGILTMEEIRKRPVVVETPDGDAIAIRPMMNMVIGFDHRANDGAGAAALLRDVRTWLESVGPGTAID
ncbi:MAG: hypothetical protein RL338_1059 [Chloroflexota bacterium]